MTTNGRSLASNCSNSLSPPTPRRRNMSQAVMTQKININATIKKFFMPEMRLQAAVLELKKLTPSDKEELLEGIMKVNGEILLSK